MRALVLLIVLACVPAETEEARGAVDVQAEPSPGSRGEPFRTEDGWTVVVETLALQTAFGVQRPKGYLRSDGRTTLSSVLFDGAKPMSVVIPGLDVGPESAGAVLFIRRPLNLPAPPTTNVDPAIAARFNQAPDGPTTDSVSAKSGPSLYLRARCEREGITVRVDAATQVGNATGDEGARVPVTIQTNALTAARVRVVVENLFAGGFVCGVEKEIAVRKLRERGVGLIVP